LVITIEEGAVVGSFFLWNWRWGWLAGAIFQSTCKKTRKWTKFTWMCKITYKICPFNSSEHVLFCYLHVPCPWMKFRKESQKEKEVTVWNHAREELVFIINIIVIVLGLLPSSLTFTLVAQWVWFVSYACSFSAIHFFTQPVCNSQRTNHTSKILPVLVCAWKCRIESVVYHRKQSGCHQYLP